MDNEVNKNLSKINIKSTGVILNWFFGVLFLIGGFSGFMSAEFIPALVMTAMGLILLPPAVKFIESKWNYKLTGVKKAIFLIVGFFIFGITSSSSDTQKDTSQITEQKQATEAQVIKEEPVVTPEAIVAQNDVVSSEQKKLYSVSKVVDGDTLAVDIDGKQEVLRLIGINTPETVDPRKPVECFGSEASAKSKEILTGKRVSLEADNTQTERDKYGRLLRYIYLEDGTNFNKLMIEEGYAYEYTYNTPYKYQADFKDAQQKAREQKKGLWAENTCNGNLTKSANSTITPTQTTTTSQTETTISQPKVTSSSYGGVCAGKKTCGQMTNCEEAKFYLNSCGVGSLDRDKDGIPCETICN